MLCKSAKVGRGRGREEGRGGGVDFFFFPFFDGMFFSVVDLR